MSGKRKHIKGKDVQQIFIPQYENLTILDFLAFAEQHPGVMQTLPAVRKEILKMPRAYIGHVIHTLVGRPFAQWVKDRVDQRHLKIAEERQMLIEMDPEIGHIYQESQAVSGEYPLHMIML